MTYIMTSLCYKHWHQLKEKVIVDNDKGNPSNDSIAMETNPAYATTAAIKMDTNPAYAYIT